MTDLLDRLKTVLADRYAIDREVGSGGMATVYLAEDLKHHRQVAVKVLRPELAVALGSERFLREIEVTAGLSHPHILPLHDSGDADGFVFYAMPYVAGESLRQRLNRETQFSIDDALRITEQVAAALDFAHRRNVIHRDIKPENILLHEGEAMVADFGIALAVAAAGGERLTETGLSIGTPEYMSPEQVAGERKVDARSDVYSLACVLYEMLAGQPPFTAATAQAVMARHLTDPVPAITTVRPGVSQPVATAITEALGKVPADRFASARAFAEALRADALEAEADTKSIGVLPFENLSPEPDQEYFSDGLTEEVINALTQLPGLHVAARTSSFWYKGKSPDLVEVGDKLKVHTVLEGSVRKAGSRVRITAQLVNVADGYHLWSERYDRDLGDVFALQDEIARTIANRLKLTLVHSAGGETVTAPTDDLEAYDLYLKGRYWWNQRGVGLQKGLECFQNAVERDPGYALAHAGIADAYCLLGFYNVMRSHDAYPKAKAAALRALELDASLSAAHAALGYVGMVYEWDWVTAEREFLRAIELDPRYVSAQLWHGIYLWYAKGDWDAAVAKTRYAIGLDPLSVFTHTQLGATLSFARRYDEALTMLDRALELDSLYFLAHHYMGETYRHQARYEEAAEALERAIRLSGASPWSATQLALTHAAAGRVSEAETVLGEWLASGRCDVFPLCVALVQFAIGDRDQGYVWLEHAYEQRDGLLPVVSWYRDFDGERDDPRLQNLLRRLAFPQ
jgi:serine/threonine-protein kinase